MNLCFGTVSASITDLHRAVPSFFLGHVLYVTVLDSSQDVASVIAQNTLDEVGVRSGRAIIVHPHHVDRFLRSSYVRGFDEMYLVPAATFHQVVVDWNSQFTSDFTNLLNGLPLSLQATMDILNASRFVADGLGLNFVCDDALLCATILRHFPTVVDH